ncbi:CD1375 family protein [Enterococcus dongliensis]|nr:CD1375 family protein [Enterococcus dongliensis]MDT2703935.1 CD1375 family protein [Enterococcus dongliensis]
MANIYVNLIQKGLKTIEEVPRTIRNEVQAILSAKTAD